MSVAQLTRRVRFSAAHRYHRPEWSPQQNADAFGACNNPHGHGHNYQLFVTVEAGVDPLTGFSADLAALDRVLDEVVVRPLDHQHLNHAIAEFADGKLVPTCENIAVWLWPRIETRLPTGTRLCRLRLHEDEDLFVDYSGR